MTESEIILTAARQILDALKAGKFMREDLVFLKTFFTAVLENTNTLLGEGKEDG